MALGTIKIIDVRSKDERSMIYIGFNKQFV